jgi:hypothetical protein
MLIGLLLLAASAFLLHNNRELLAGRGVPLSMSREMRGIVAAQQGVVDVPDLFAIVLGASSLIVTAMSCSTTIWMYPLLRTRSCGRRPRWATAGRPSTTYTSCPSRTPDVPAAGRGFDLSVRAIAILPGASSARAGEHRAGRLERACGGSVERAGELGSQPPPRQLHHQMQLTSVA